MKLASIETISAIRPHANADRLELATVLGWQTVVRKGEFKVGDRCVFVVIDTILPPAPWSEFLANKSAPELPIRLRSAKLRGEYSQGLVLPLTVLAEHLRDWQEGADIGGELGVKKYEKEIPGVLSGEAKGPFPTHFAPRTDEDNGLSNLNIVHMVCSEAPLIATLKLDGSSCTLVVENGACVDVCSRNQSLREDEKNGFWGAARKLGVDKLSAGRWVLQGELMGPGIQGNQLKLKEPTLYLFQVRTPSGSWQPYNEMILTAALIDAESVPIVAHFGEAPDIAGLQEIADCVTVADGKPAEGIVVRPLKATTFGNGRPAGFKIINRNYGE